MFGIVAVEGILSLIIGILLSNNPIIVDWATYYFLPFRCLDFCVGCVLGKIYQDEPVECIKSRKSLLVYSLLELIAVLLIVKMPSILQEAKLGLLINRTFPYLVISIIVVFCFSKEEGVFSKALSMKLFIFLGEYTGNMFLIHYVIIIFFDWMTQHFGRTLFLTSKVNRLFTSFFISLITSMIYELLVKKIIVKRNENGKFT